MIGHCRSLSSSSHIHLSSSQKHTMLSLKGSMSDLPTSQPATTQYSLMARITLAEKCTCSSHSISVNYSILLHTFMSQIVHLGTTLTHLSLEAVVVVCKLHTSAFKPYSTLLVTSLQKIYSLHAAVSGGDGWGHPQGAMHMAAARLGCKRAMVGTEWVNSCPGCMNRHRKRYSHLLGGSFQAGKVAWALSGYLPTENADTIACSLLSGSS